MGSQEKNYSRFRIEIDNLSEKEDTISSHTFVTNDCEWYLNINLKGDGVCDDPVCLFLCIANPELLERECQRKISFKYVLLNQSDEELYRSRRKTQHNRFCANHPGWGFQKTLPLRKLQRKGFLKNNDRLILDVYISSVDEKDGVVSERKETVDINGFQVFASHVNSARKLFVDHPDIAEDFKPKNQVVKTEYMNVLLNLVETVLNKPSQNHSETELSNAHIELSELMEQGFKLEWLKSKLDEISLKRKKADADFQQLDVLPTKTKIDKRGKRIEFMELDLSKLNCLKKKIEELSLERKKSDDADGSRVKEMEGRIKSLEMDKEEESSVDGFLLVDEFA